MREPRHEGHRLEHVLDWRRWLVYTHRWLGIAGCVLFVAWFISGVVMMYARMPVLAPEEQLARAPALNLSLMKLAPADAAKIAGVNGTSVQVSMLRDRPVYRFGGRTPRIVFGDTGGLFEGMGEGEAREVARRYEPQYVGAFHYDGYVTEPDQWTLQARQLMPMHRFALDDDDDTRLYVSEVTGDVVLRTTARERFWAYLGPVIHWIYFTPLRKDGPLWNDVIVWSSSIGCVMCASGLIWGLMRFSPAARFRLKRQHAHSPYAGMMKWHHYAGLLFGLVTLTWTYSGLLSMGPFGWFEPVGARGRQLRASSDGSQRLEQVSLEDLRAAVAAMQDFEPRSLEAKLVQGKLFWTAERPPALGEADAWRSPSLIPRAARPSLERRYVSATDAERGTFTSFPREAMVDVARTTMAGVPVEDAVWLDSYDGYYYDARGSLPLPVLRVRYNDPQKTWLYLDPSRGGVVERLETATRTRRWFYQGLHSLDFPFLYYRRPLWDIVVIALSIGGAVLSATTITPAWRRLARHARRWAPRVTLSKRVSAGDAIRTRFQ